MNSQNIPAHINRPNLLRDTLKRLESQHLPPLSEADDDDISLTNSPRLSRLRNTQMNTTIQSNVIQDSARGCSAKELISRYETMSPHPTSPATLAKAQNRPHSQMSNIRPPTALKRHSSPNMSAWDNDDDDADDPRKNHFPIRKSFRSLVGAFNKKAAKWKEEANMKMTTEHKPYSLRRAQTTQASMPNISAPIPITVPPIDPLRFSNEDLTCDLSLRCGNIIYLSRPYTASGSYTLLPLWIHCYMTLRESQLAVSYVSSEGKPEVQTISLAGCVDVRPLSCDDVGEHERAMMPDRVEPDNIQEPRVFELVYGDGRGEKFGAVTVKERAKWLSAIWKAIQPPSDHVKASTTVKSSQPISLPPPQNPQAQPPLLAALPSSELVDPLRASHLAQRTLTVPEALARFTERALPPLPPEASPASRTTLTLPEESSTPRRQSASVRDLRARSVVSNRVAAMQAPPPTESASPALSTRKRQLPRITTRPEQPQPVYFGRPVVVAPLKPAPNNQSSRKSDDDAESLLESYLSRSPTLSYCENPRRAPSPPSSVATRPPLSRETTSYRTSICSAPNWSADEQQAGCRKEATAAEFVEPVLDALDMQALSHDNQSAALRAQVCALTDEVARVAGAMEGVDGRLGEPSGGQVERLRTVLGEATEAIEDLRDRAMAPLTGGAGAGHPGSTEVCNLRNVGQRDDLAEVIRALEDLKEAVGAQPGSLQVIQSQLGQLVNQVSLLRMVPDPRQQQTTLPDNGSGPQMKQALDMLQVNHDRQSLQLEQSANTTRYLGELNTWLKSFVDNAGTQNHAMAASMQRLCAALGVSTTSDGGYGPVGQLGQVLAMQRESGNGIAAMHQAVDGMVASMNEERRLMMGNPLTIDAVQNLLDHQRLEQERSLRALAAELSADIKGERLRFVEAMKEATEIHVQTHVEQFKQVLAREVLAVSHEVGRLQSERQLLRRQVADLHAHHTGQRQGGMGLSIPAGYGAPPSHVCVSRSMSFQGYPHATPFQR